MTEPMTEPIAEPRGGPTTGPVEWVALAFPGDTVDPAVVPAMARLVEADTVRILDLLVVTHTADGEVRVSEYDEAPEPLRAALDGLDGEVLDLIGVVDLPVIAAELEPGSTALVVVWESRWAADLSRAVLDAGGRLLTHDRIPRDIVAAALAAGGNDS